MKRFVCQLFVVAVMFSFVSLVRAETPVEKPVVKETEKPALEPKDEWFTPVALNINGIRVTGFIYTGPGQFIAQNQVWIPPVSSRVKQTVPETKKVDPIEELRPKKTESKK